MHSPIHIRRYQPDDLAQTVSVWRASKRHAFPAVERQRQGVGTTLLQKAREQSPRGLLLTRQ